MKLFLINVLIACYAIGYSQAIWGGSGSSGNAWRVGNIGINTLPNWPLDVSTSITNSGINITQTTNGWSCLKLSNTTIGGHIWTVLSTGNGNLLEGSGNFSILDQSNGSHRLFITGNNGQVGIGTILPTAQLHVESTSTSNYATFYSKADHNYNYGYSCLSAVGRDLTKAFAVQHFNWNGTPGQIKETFVVYGSGYTEISTGAWDAFAIKDGSGVCNFKVKNSGTVYSREIFVQSSNFPDYVFSPDYKLLDLKETKQYILKNHKLPNLPSAAEVNKNGMNLGEIERLSVEKIEELYLYIIQLQEQIDELKKK